MKVLRPANITRYISSIVALVFLLATTTDTIFAQVSDPQWSQPLQLSSPNADAKNTYQPAIIADKFGKVHAFWAELDLLNNQTSLMYAQYDGATWCTPIALIARSGMIRYPRVTLDDLNYLHLTWVGSQYGPVFYSKVHALQAGSRQSWSPPILINFPAFQAVIYTEDNGDLHLLYSILNGTFGGMWNSKSVNMGITWSSGVNLDPSRPIDYDTIQMYVESGDSGDVHVTWWYAQANNMSTGAVMYARSLDSGQNWATAVKIDESGTISPTISMAFASPRIAVSDNRILLIWSGGAVSGVPTMRITSYSVDYGATWSPKQAIASFGTLHGQASDGISVDGDGRVHYLADIRYPSGFYHAIWDQFQWGTPLKFFDIVVNPDLSSAPGSIHVHYASSAVRAGNQLITVFMNSPNDPQGKVFAMQRDLTDVITPPKLLINYFFPFIPN